MAVLASWAGCATLDHCAKAPCLEETKQAEVEALSLARSRQASEWTCLHLYVALCDHSFHLPVFLADQSSDYCLMVGRGRASATRQEAACGGHTAEAGPVGVEIDHIWKVCMGLPLRVGARGNMMRRVQRGMVIEEAVEDTGDRRDVDLCRSCD